jgi:excisionase family DNA binding protein
MKTLRMLPSNESSPPVREKPFPHPGASLLSTHSAWRILRRRTGGNVSRATFYRWLESGKLSSVRLGFRIYIPLPALDDFIRRSLRGE